MRVLALSVRLMTYSERHVHEILILLSHVRETKIDLGAPMEGGG